MRDGLHTLKEALKCAKALAASQIDVPVQLRRCGMAMRLIVGDRSAASGEVNPKLVALIGRAQRWLEALASGRVCGLAEIAAQDQVTSSYVARVMRLAFLAPDIVERIINGEAPADLTAERMSRISEVPIDWRLQRSLPGMSS